MQKFLYNRSLILKKSWVIMESSHYVAVLKLVNCYVPIEVNGNQKQFLANTQEDLKATQVAAQSFAEQWRIPYKSDLFLVTEQTPIITIVPYEGKWCPAKALSDGIQVLKNFEGQEEGGLIGSKEWVTMIAQSIAIGLHADFLPQIGEAIQLG